VDIGLPAAAVRLARWILQPSVVPHRHHAAGLPPHFHNILSEDGKAEE